MKKLLTILLSTLMIASLCCVNVFAEEQPATSGTTTYDNNTDGEDTSLPEDVTQFNTTGDNKSTVDEYYTVTKAAGTDDGTIDYYVTVSWTRTNGTATAKGDTYHWDASKQMYERTTVENELSNNTPATVEFTVKNYSNAKVNYEVSYATADGYDTTETADTKSGSAETYSKTGSLANYITYSSAGGTTLADEGIENVTEDNNETKVTTTGEATYTHEHTAPSATYKGSVTLNAGDATKSAFTNQVVGTYTINITAAPVAKQTVTGTTSESGAITLTAQPNPAEDNTKTTTVTFPAGALTDESGQTANLTVEATPLLAANNEFTITTTNEGAVGAVDLTVKVNGVEVEDFKDSDGNSIDVTVVTYIAKGLTLNLNENKVGILYNGTDGKDQPTFVSYDSSTGRLEFTTTHFSSFLIDADQTAYIERNNTAYMTLKEAVEKSEENDEIIMIKDSTIGVKKVVGAKVLGGKTVNPGTTVDDGTVVEINKNLTIDFNGKKIYNSIAEDRAIHLHDCTLTINGNVSDEENPGEFIVSNSSSYGLIKVYADSKDTALTVNNLVMSGDTDDGALIKAFDGTSTSSTITLNINNCEAETNIRFQDCNSLLSKLMLNVTGGEYTTGDYTFAHDSYSAGSKAVFTNVKATSTYGPIIEVAGTQAEFTDCDFKITDLDPENDFCSVTIGVSYEGTATINSGTYTSDEYDALQIYPTGGTFNIKGGTFNSESNAIKTYDEGTNNVNISGGTFNGALDFTGSDTTVSITGGTFTVDPSSFVAQGYVASKSGETWTVSASN